MRCTTKRRLRGAPKCNHPAKAVKGSVGILDFRIRNFQLNENAAPARFSWFRLCFVALQRSIPVPGKDRSRYSKWRVEDRCFYLSPTFTPCCAQATATKPKAKQNR